MTVQNVVIFGLGAVAGAAVASIFLKDKYKKQYEKLYSDELDSYKESFEKMRKLDRSGELIQNKEYMGVDKKAESVISNAEKRLIGYASMYSQDGNSRAVKNEVDAVKSAENYLAESESPSEEYETYEDTQMRKINENKGKFKRKDPWLIRADEYDNEYLYHGKVSLLYFTEDDILSEELSGNEVDDVDAVVGDCLDKFGFRTNDEKVIYVRNVNLGNDYEIAKIYGAYADEGRYYK